MTVVPGARRARHAQPAVERLDPVGEPAQPGAARVVGAADAVVGDLDRRRAVAGAQTRTVAGVAWAYLATLVSASEATK